MAEVFSVIAAAIGVIDLAGRSSSKLARLVLEWRHAPTLILTLVNETADLQVLLGRLKDAGSVVRRQVLSDRALSDALEAEFRKSTQHLHDLEVFIEELERSSPRTRKRKWVQKKALAAELQAKLRTSRLCINDLFMSHMM